MKITLIPQPTKENPAVVHDYPWGFKLKCEKRFWIEDAGRKGMRLVTQTVDPRNGRPSAPKASTYNLITILVRDSETGHYEQMNLHGYNCEPARIMEFKQLCAYLPLQYSQVCQLERMRRADPSYRAEWEKVDAEQVAAV